MEAQPSNIHASHHDDLASLDMVEVRRSFPALRQDQVFLDNAGGSQTLGSVIDSIRDYLANTNVQLGATYSTSKKSTDLYTAGYEASAKFINASADEIVLGSSTTSLFRTLSFTLSFKPGDELVVSGLDHEANIASWVDLAERQDLGLKWWLPPEQTTSPKLTPDNLAGLLGPRTRLVAFTHASNILGTVHDVKAICEAVHSRCPGALVCVDGVQLAPHRRVDVKELGVDFYALSWYKAFGPHIAMLYASPLARTEMRSLGHYFNKHNTVQDKMALGGSSYELVASIPAAATYAEERFEGFAVHEAELQKILLEYLASREDVTVYGETTSEHRVRVPTVSFTVRGWDSAEVVAGVESLSNFGCRSGIFYSNRLGDFLGLGEDGVVRVSMVHYNTVDEIRGFVAILDAVLSKR